MRIGITISSPSYPFSFNTSCPQTRSLAVVDNASANSYNFLIEILRVPFSYCSIT
ncbi:hypothetical protein O1Q06_02910 [Wolbachia endosymbiont of Tetranychus urticae]